MERRALEEERSLLRARLRLFQQQGPGLGSVFNIAPDFKVEKDRLEGALLENERQMEMLGSTQNMLEDELSRLCEVLMLPERYVDFSNVTKRINSMNILIDDTQQKDDVCEINFSLASLLGKPATKRAFVIAHFPRTELPEQTINFDQAAQLL